MLTSDIKCPTQVTLERTSCLVIDGQAQVVAFGKQIGDTFGRYFFVECILQSEQHIDRSDIIVDRNRSESIKGEPYRNGARDNKTIIVSGGFREDETVRCSNTNVNRHWCGCVSGCII